MTRAAATSNKSPRGGVRETTILISPSDVFQTPSVAIHKIYDSITESLFLYEEFYRCAATLSEM